MGEFETNWNGCHDRRALVYLSFPARCFWEGAPTDGNRGTPPTG